MNHGGTKARRRFTRGMTETERTGVGRSLKSRTSFHRPRDCRLYDSGIAPLARAPNSNRQRLRVSVPQWFALLPDSDHDSASPLSTQESVRLN